jgi:ATP-dependent DNA helicase RecQ
VPFLALTATATPDVVDDIQEKLLFREKNVLKTSFERKNLVYLVRHVEDKQKYVLKKVKQVKGSGIIYVRTRKRAHEISTFLKSNEISSDFYHAGLSNKIRHLKHEDWNKGKIRIIVATNAFGMGIDKSNVRFVIHHDPPDSLEAYFQEAGRAGRDNKKAYAVLLFNDSDKKNITNRVTYNFPEIDKIKRIYEALGNYFQITIGGGKNGVYDFNIAEFCKTYRFNMVIVYNALKALQREGYIEFTDELNNPSRVHFLVERDELYRFQVSNLQFDRFIKLLLRSYTGLFAEFVSIDEDSLARKANIDQDQIYQYLIKLSKLKIIRYIPRRKTPLVIFTEERLDSKSLLISGNNYRKRRDIYLEKLEKIKEYASQENRCRSQFLLDYFGEKKHPPCEQCDICAEKDDPAPGKTELEQIASEIEDQLKNNPLSPDDLVDRLNYDEKIILKTIQLLLDNNKLYYQQDKKLRWREQ